MAYYHVFVCTQKFGNYFSWYVEYDLEKKRVERIVEGYNRGEKFLLCGLVFTHSDIIQIAVFSSEKFLTGEYVLPNGKKIGSTDPREVCQFFGNGLVEGVDAANREFDFTPPQEGTAVSPKPKTEIETRKEVFIVHGRDVKQALLLQKHLRDDLDIHARMFEDFKKKAGSTTIIEQLQYIWENAGYVFVIATPDDCGVLHEEFEKSLNTLLRGKEKVNAEEVTKLLEALKTRARQNVVFEFGLFMGALGRDNVYCLLQDSTQERPSDIDGILYTLFNKSIDEKFVEIDAKLKDWLGKKV